MYEDPKFIKEERMVSNNDGPVKLVGHGSSWRECLERKGLPESILVLLTLLVYARSLSLGFVYDDHATVNDPTLWNWKDIPSLFTQDLIRDHASNFYRPLTLLWIGLVHRLAGTSPVTWHLSAILLHLLCVILVFRLACNLLDDRKLATFAAAVFALHPTHVEAVTWISDAADPLMTALLLLSALALLRWLKGGNPGYWIASLLLAAACCFVKETGVLAPAMLLVLAFSVRNKASQPAIVLTGFSLFLSSFAFLVLRSQILQGFSHPLSTAGNREMLLTEPAALWFYLSHLVLPLRLGPCYPLAFVTDWRSADFLVPLLSLAAVVAVLGWLFRSLSDRRLFWFCAVWGLAPLIAPLYLKLFPEFELVHDRYLYIPTIALGVALAAGLKRLSNATPGLPIRNYVSIATLVLLLASAAQTISYENVWRNDISLFQRAVALTPRNARALVNLGVNKLQEGDHVEGSALLKRALALQPDNAFALFDLGADAWNNNNDPATAEAYIQKALALEVHSNWLVLFANVELKLGRIPQAESAARDAIALAPNERGAHMLLGLVCLTQRDPATAVHEFSAELELDPEDVAALQAIQVARAQNAQQH